MFNELIKKMPKRFIVGLAIALVGVFLCLLIDLRVSHSPFIFNDKILAWFMPTSLSNQIQTNPYPNVPSTRLNKVRELVEGEVWKEEHIGFFIRFKNIVGYIDDPKIKYKSKFTIELKTPESNIIETEVYDLWKKQFSANNRDFILTIKHIDYDKKTIIAFLQEKQ